MIAQVVVEATAETVADLKINDPELYAVWLKRWQADRSIRTILVPRDRRRRTHRMLSRNNENNIVLSEEPPDERITPERQSFPEKVAGFVSRLPSFMRAVTGPRMKAGGAAVRSRLAACRSCEHRTIHNSNEYCKACGCPKWKLSELQSMVRFASHACPVGKWGPVHGAGLRARIWQLLRRRHRPDEDESTPGRRALDTASG